MVVENNINNTVGDSASVTLVNKKQINNFEFNKERFRSVVETATDAIISIDSEGKIMSWNHAAEIIFGYSEDEIIGKPITLTFPEKLHEMHNKSMRKVVETGKSKLAGTTIECIGLKKGGEEFPLELSISVWDTKEGRFFTGIIRNITERKVAEEELKRSIEEKEILLKEIHHRVKNNLMVISSLLNLQSQYITDKADLAIFKESQTRARSMALIHERLYQSTDLKRIDFGEYIQTLSTDLYHTYVRDPKQVKINTDIENIMLDINTAIPLGLIVNELLTNSIKHAFPPGTSGEITLQFYKKGEKLILIVKDNGIGFPQNLDFCNTDSLGLQLVNSLTSQINGEIELDQNQGTKFKIIFNEPEYSLKQTYSK